jgi:hypothetical protein
MALTKLVFLLAALAAGAAHAQIAFRDAASAGVASTGNIFHRAAGAVASRGTCGSIAPGLPAGTTAGDLLIAFVVAKEDAAAVAMPGWNQYFSHLQAGIDYQPFIFWRIAAGGDPNTITQAGTCNLLIGQIAAFGNVDNVTPFQNDPLPAGNWTYSNSGTITSGTETTTMPNSMLIFGVFIGDNNGTGVPAGFSESFDSGSATGTDGQVSLKYRLESSAGAKGPFSVTKGGGADPNHGVLFALRPAGLRISVPAGTLAGDLMVAAIAVRPSGTTITTPTGWSAQPATVQGGGNSSRQQIFYRFATAADELDTTSYAWTFDAASTGAVGGIVAYSGVDPVTPFDVFAGNTTPVAPDPNTTHQATSVTTTVPNTMVVSTHSFTSAEPWSPPVGMNERVDVASIATPSAVGISLEMNDVTQGTAGATGDKEASVAANGDTGVAHLFALRPAVTVNHYAISVLSATVANCDYAEITVSGHNAAHAAVNPPSSRTVTLSVSAGAATAAWQPALVAGTGTWTPAGATATYQWPGTESSFTVRLRQSAVLSLTVNVNDGFVGEDPAEDPAISFVDSAFRISNGANAPLSISTQISGKPSDTGFNAQSLFLQAIRTDTVTGACTSIFGSGQEVDIEVGAQCNNPATCSQNVTLTTTATGGSPTGAFVPAGAGTYPATIRFRFTTANAEAPFLFRYADAGQITLQFRHVTAAPAATITGTSNAFVARPFGIAFRGATEGSMIQHGTLPTDALLAAAGDNFTMTLAAYQWAAGEDSDNDGIPDASANITDNGLTPNFALDVLVDVPVGGNLPGVASGAIQRGPACAGAALVPAAGFSGGAATLTDWCYTEAGNVLLAATASNYITAGITVSGHSGLDGTGTGGGHVGRFRPKHFALSAASLINRAAASCAPASSFTYMNERLDLGFTLTAQNTQGGTTQNYHGLYAKLDVASIAALSLGARSGATNLTSRIDLALGSSGSWTNGVANVTVQTAITRAAPDSPDGPYPGLAFGIAPVDSDTVAMNTLDLDVDGAGGNDHASVGTSVNGVRFGRLRMTNAIGSEKLALPVPIQVQHWNGSGFVTNSDDDCTTIARGEIAMDFNPPSNLTACETAASTASIAFTDGVGSLTLTAPGAGNNGSVLLTVNLGSAGGNACDPGSVPAGSAGRSYLLGRWNSTDEGGDGTFYDDKPSARAAFGLYGSQPSNFIYFRENY